MDERNCVVMDSSRPAQPNPKHKVKINGSCKHGAAEARLGPFVWKCHIF